MTGRKWLDILGFEGRYQVSDDGFIRSLPDVGHDGKFRTGRILRPGQNNKGYLSVVLSAGNEKQSVRVHRVVAEAFIENPDQKPEVNHKNGVKTDNRTDNLEWATASENQTHRYRVLQRPDDRKGRTGYQNKNSKTVSRVDPSSGETVEFGSASEAARQLGIQQTGISAAARGAISHYKGYLWFYVESDK